MTHSLTLTTLLTNQVTNKQSFKVFIYTRVDKRSRVFILSDCLRKKTSADLKSILLSVSKLL